MALAAFIVLLPALVAGALAGVLREKGGAEIQAIGAGAGGGLSWQFVLSFGFGF